MEIINLFITSPMQMKKGDREALSALTIQRHWRGYLARRKYARILKRQKKKVFTVMELLQSEQTYCENLEFVIREVLKPSKTFITDAEVHRELFSNIEEIHAIHKHFLGFLEQAMKEYNPHSTRLSKVLLTHLFNRDEFKKAYTDYCFHYRTTDQAIKLLMGTNSAFTEHLKVIGLSSIHQTLESYMIKPVQRLCKYGIIINQYYRNMEPDHIDYADIGKTSQLISKLVHETNDQVEEFLMRERLEQLRRIYPSFFAKLYSSKKLRMYYQASDIIALDVVKQQETKFKSLILFENSVILIPKSGDDLTFSNFIYCRELMNLKHYKNIVQLVDQNRYNYLQFAQEKDKKELMKILNQKMKQNEQVQFRDHIKVNILGTETRESFFSQYTVYIVQIDDHGKTSTIYPRFKDLLKVQEMVMSRGMRLDPPLLAKEFISKFKTKTIEKRKLTIQEFLQRVFNDCPVADIKEAEEILGLSQFAATVLQRISSEVEEITILLPNLQRVKVLTPIHDSKIRDLKHLISEQMGMESSNQFELFQIRNKNYSFKKLLYEDEPVKKIYDEQRQSQSSINLFRDTIEYLYTRHYYLPRAQEQELYKCDQARAQLELSVIHWQVGNYRLEEEVMLTFMCLFAIYIHLPIENSDKLNFFIKQLSRKIYKVSEEEFRVYFSEVRRMVAGQDNLAQNLPLLIIKVVSNSYLYQTQQFQVQIHHKVYSSLKKIYSGLDEKIMLGLHPQLMYLLSIKDKTVIAKFSYSQLTLLQTNPKAVVFQLPHTQTPLNLKTGQVFQISKLFDIYRLSNLSNGKK